MTTSTEPKAAKTAPKKRAPRKAPAKAAPKPPSLRPDASAADILAQEGPTPFVAGGFYLRPLAGGWAVGQITEAERVGNIVRGLLRVPGRAPLFVTADSEDFASLIYVGQAISAETLDEVAKLAGQKEEG